MATLTELLDFSNPHTLRSEAEYDAAVAEIDALLELEPARGTSEYDRLELLSVLVEAYDEEHYRIADTATPQAVVDFLPDRASPACSGRTSSTGGRGAVSEFFAGKRPLSIT